MATQVLQFNQAQQAVLNVISCLQSEQDLEDLKRTLIKFMNDRLQREMDKLWESGEMSNEKLQEMQSEHLRTAYKQTDYAEKYSLRYQLSLADNCKKKQELFLMGRVLEWGLLSLLYNRNSRRIRRNTLS